MEILFSKEFKKKFIKIKDKNTRLKIIKQIKKLGNSSETGKPLRYQLKNHRSLKIHPFRIIYRIQNNKIIINYFEHRKGVYK